MSGRSVNNRRPATDGQRRRQERTRPAQQMSQKAQQQRFQQSAAPAPASGHMATQEEYMYLISLRDGYKSAALGFKLTGNRDKALSMLKISKQLNIMTRAIEEGKPVDLDGLPPKPPKISLPTARRRAPQPPTVTQFDTAPTRIRANPKIEEQMEQLSLEPSRLPPPRSPRAPPSPRATSSTLAQDEDEQLAQAVEAVMRSVVADEDVSKLFDAPTSASTVMEALEQRLEKYQTTMHSATAEGNAAKARRLGRIVKQYENAMKAATKGLDFDYDSLPCPPGYPPIPRQGNRVVIKVEYDANRPSTSQQQQPQPLTPTPQPKPVRPKTELNAKVDRLTEQQNVLKRTAVAAKDAGDKSEALRLLRLAKGLEPIIEAVKCGLPFDETSIPPELRQMIQEHL